MEPLRQYMLQEEQTIFFGAELFVKKTQDILSMIKSNTDVFAWKHTDMVGVDPLTTHHHLRKRKGCCLVKQKLRRFHLERHAIVKTKVEKLIATRFIREVQYLE